MKWANFEKWSITMRIIDLPLTWEKTLNEVHCHVRPYRVWYAEWLQQTGGVRMFNLVPLACHTCPHEVLHCLSCVWNVEVGLDPV
jgi:hypothetical protein